jgi:hypothetical protein
MVKQLLLLFVGTVLIVAATVQLTQNYSLQPDTTTHTDINSNYAFDYPANWWLDDGLVTTMLTSFELGSLPNLDFIPADETKLDIHLASATNHPSFEAYLTDELLNMSCVVGEPFVFALDNGGQAVTIAGQSAWGYSYHIIYVNMDSRNFRVVAYGDFTPVQRIIQSFRTITPTEQPAFETIKTLLEVPTQSRDCTEI